MYLIFLFNTGITYFLFAYKTTLFTAIQRNDILNNIYTVVTLIQYIIQIIILCVWKNYYVYLLVNTGANILNNVLVEFFSRKKYHEYVCRGQVPNSEKKKIWKMVYGLMIQKICGVTRNSLDNICISTFLGLNVVAVYNNYYTIMNAVIIALGVITSSMVASVGNSIASESKEKNYEDMQKFNFVYMWISGWFTICLLCLYQPFMKLWMGEQNMFPMSVVICMCIYFYALKVGDIRAVYAEAAGLWYEGKYRALAETITNVVLNIVLGKYYGVIGIIVATLISLLTINFGYGSTIVFKYYFKNKKVLEYFRYHLLYFIVTLLVATTAYYLCKWLYRPGIGGLIINVFVCATIPNIMYFIIYCKTKIFKSSLYFLKQNVNKRKISS